MEHDFYTYQEFYTHTKGNLYLLMILSLICIAFFWNFLAGKDKNKTTNINTANNKNGKRD